MHHDVIDLRGFYYNRALGRVVQRVLRDRLLTLWPVERTAGMTVAGFGFPVPLLRPYVGRARRVTALMPAGQGALPWPAGQPNHSVLCDPAAWPVETGSVDRLVFLHGLESSDHQGALLAEAFRVLGPGGRMVLMVPNRTGLWARSEGTPFGTGRSYTAGQLESLARGAGFLAEGSAPALYIPPSERRFWVGSAQMWERAGTRIASVLVAGVVVAEFSKQVRGALPPGNRVTVPSPLKVLGGIARPRPLVRPAGEGAPLGHEQRLPTRHRADD